MPSTDGLWPSRTRSFGTRVPGRASIVRPVAIALVVLLIAFGALAGLSAVAIADDRGEVDEDNVILQEVDDGEYVTSGEDAETGDPIKNVRSTLSPGNVVVSGSNVETAGGVNVETADGYDVIKVDGSEPDIRADVDGELERLVVNGTDVETENGRVVTVPGGSVFAEEHPFDESYFDVDITSINDPIGEGEELEVSAEISNIDHADDTQQINLTVGGTELSETVQIDGGESETVDFTYETESGDASIGELTVESDDNSDTEDVTIDEAGIFVEVSGTNGPVVEGDDLVVTIDVERVGSLYNGNQDDQERDYGIRFAVDGGEDTTRLVNLGPSSSTTVDFTYETEHGDASTVDFTAWSLTGDDSTTGSAAVHASEFEVTIDDVNDPVPETSELTVDATIENHGRATEEQTIGFYVDRSVGDDSSTEWRAVDNTTVELGQDDSTSVSFTYETEEGDAPEVGLEVRSADDEDDVIAAVDPSGAFFDIVSMDADTESLDAGEELSVTANVSNTGNEAGSQTVALLIGDDIETSEEVQLDAGESDSVTLSAAVPDDAGTYNYEIVTTHDSSSGSLEVTDAPASDDPDDDNGDDADEPEPPEDDEIDPPEIESEEDGLPWALIIGGLLVAVLVAGLVVGRRRIDTDEFDSIQEGIVEAGETAKGYGYVALAVAGDRLGLDLVDGTESGASGGIPLLVRNAAPGPAACRVRCRTPSETIFTEEFQLEPGDETELQGLPEEGAFEVAVGVKNGPRNTKVFDTPGISQAGVRIRPDGIDIVGQ